MGKVFADKWKRIWTEEKENENGKVEIIVFYSGAYHVGVMIVRVCKRKSNGFFSFSKRVKNKLLEGSYTTCLREAITEMDAVDIDNYIELAKDNPDE